MTPPRLATERIVAAVDFSDDWENMVAHAAHLARLRGSGGAPGSVHLVHVIQPPNWLMGQVLGTHDLEAHQQELEESASRRLDAVVNNLGELEARASVMTGKPSVETLAAIERDEAGVLVLGMAEPTGTSLGSNADRLFRVSPVPVYAVGPRPPEEIRSVLVPTALGPGGATAISVALDLVAPGGTVYPLYMAALPAVMRGWQGNVMELRQQMTHRAEEELRRHVASIPVPEGKHVEPILRTNLEQVTAERTIVKEARERGVQLICLALGGRELPPGMLIGRVSEKVIRSLPCSLLALPDAWVDAVTRESDA